MFWAFGMLLIAACQNQNSEPIQKNNTAQSQEELVKSGEVIFQANCNVCHALAPNTSTGMAPMLDSLKSNWPDATALAAFIKNAPAEMQSTKRSRYIYQQWKDKAQMPPYQGMDEGEIAALLAYLYKAAP